MKTRLAFATILAAAVTAFAAPREAAAITAAPALNGPVLVEEAACRMVRSRVVRPNGRVVYRTTRRCTPDWRPRARDCRIVYKRVVRPNGAVVRERVRRCR